MPTKGCLTTWSLKTPSLYMQNGGQATFRPTGLAEKKEVCRKGWVFGDMIYTDGLKMAAAAQKNCVMVRVRKNGYYFSIAYGYILSPVSEDKICLQGWYDGISLVK